MIGGSGFTYSVTAGALPSPLSLHPTTAQITGTPNASGVYFFEVTATNGVLTLSERYGITISTKPASAFNLWITYNGGAMPPANAITALTAAHARWEAIVTGDAGPAVTYPSSGLAGVCTLVTGSLLHGAFIEDVAILMGIGPIDGPNNTLARGGFCGFSRNPAPPATITGQMLLDQADASIASATYLQDVILHEIAHAFGIGTLWQS
ncbi:MAG: hypothetical protein EXR91_09455 [Gemmatimonadetes bacterium]|nr:hypothetical protein [Gemmatimonadota bacterium]